MLSPWCLHGQSCCTPSQGQSPSGGTRDRRETCWGAPRSCQHPPMQTKIRGPTRTAQWCTLPWSCAPRSSWIWQTTKCYCEAVSTPTACPRSHHRPQDSGKRRTEEESKLELHQLASRRRHPHKWKYRWLYRLLIANGIFRKFGIQYGVLYQYSVLHKFCTNPKQTEILERWTKRTAIIGVVATARICSNFRPCTRIDLGARIKTFAAGLCKTGIQSNMTAKTDTRNIRCL